MPKKNVRLNIDSRDFPMLFKIRKEDFYDVCFDILELGYDSYFIDKNKQMDNKTIKTVDHLTDSEKYEINKLQTDLYRLNIT